MSESDKPSRTYREWLRQKAWPFKKQQRETGDSILTHVEEFQEEARLLGKRVEDKNREPKVDVDKDKPPH
jgi:hypothetical protein